LENKLLHASVRAGYEWGRYKRRRAGIRSGSAPDGLLAQGELAWKPQKTTSFTVSVSHEVGYSLASAFQRNTWVGGKVEQEIPKFDMTAFAEAIWRVQEPRHVPNLRAMYYVVGLGWSRWDELVVGLQATYTKSRSRPAKWEVLTAGLSITLRY
jgi:hypothetical protein